jgi:hypothetical protein
MTCYYDASIANDIANVNSSSSDQKELPRLHERSRFDRIKIHTARESPAIELYLMIPRFLFPILENRYLLAERNNINIFVSTFSPASR